jgi:hypothetical protein
MSKNNAAKKNTKSLMIGKPCQSPEQVCKEFNSKNSKKGSNMSKKDAAKAPAETKKTEAAPAVEVPVVDENAPDKIPITISKENFDKLKAALLVTEEINERARKIGTEIAAKSLKSANKVAYKDGSWGVELVFTDDSTVSYPKTSRTKKLLFDLGMGVDPAIEAAKWRSNYNKKKGAEKKDEKAAEKPAETTKA